MSKITLVLLAAGSSSRFGLGVKKQWLRIGSDPLWLFVANRYKSYFKEIVIVGSMSEIGFMKQHADFKFVSGGNTRQESLKNAMTVVESEFVLVSDVARACVSSELLEKIISLAGESDCIVPYLSVNDTVVFEDKTVDRSKIKLIQTPQLSRAESLKKALDTTEEFTDESSAIVACGMKRSFVEGESGAHKLTTLADLQKLPCMFAPSQDSFTGTGFDVHAFDTAGEMFLGGVKIESEYGFKAHSDGDVAIHALIDALLGAAGMGDIGLLFPDSDDRYKGIDSKELLREVVSRVHGCGFVVVNADITVIAEHPRLSAYKDKIRHQLALLLQIAPQNTNVKATTTEKLGFVGRKEGVAVMATVNLKYFDWTKH